MNGYFAIQLDKPSCNVVKKLATKDILVSDHVTLAYNPDNNIYKRCKVKISISAERLFLKIPRMRPWKINPAIDDVMAIIR